MKRTISAMRGPGSLKHNRRAFTAENVDAERTRYNVVYKDEPIKQVYHELFDDALERYNSKQKRKDRCISDYYEHLRTGKQEKVFHELIVQIGDKDNTGVTTEDGQWAATILDEYMQDFEKRNPTLRVFGAFLHMDEATPHLHIDYIPVGHYKRGQDVQNGIAQALKEMGFGEGKQAIARWRAAEVEVLNKICLEHGIQPLAPEKARGTLQIPEYKEKRRQADELAVQNAQAAAELSEKQAKSEKLDAQIEKKTATVNAIMSYLPDLEKGNKVEDDCLAIRQELDSLLDGKLSIMKHKDDIIAKVEKLGKIAAKAADASHRKSLTIYDLRELLQKKDNEYDDLWHKAAERSGRINELTYEVSTLQAKADVQAEFIGLSKKCEPQKFAEVKQLQEHIQAQREEEQIQQSATRTKKSWGLE